MDSSLSKEDAFLEEYDTARESSKRGSSRWDSWKETSVRSKMHDGKSTSIRNSANASSLSLSLSLGPSASYSNNDSKNDFNIPDNNTNKATRTIMRGESKNGASNRRGCEDGDDHHKGLDGPGAFAVGTGDAMSVDHQSTMDTTDQISQNNNPSSHHPFLPQTSQNANTNQAQEAYHVTAQVVQEDDHILRERILNSAVIADVLKKDVPQQRPCLTRTLLYFIFILLAFLIILGVFLMLLFTRNSTTQPFPDYNLQSLTVPPTSTPSHYIYSERHQFIRALVQPLSEQIIDTDLHRRLALEFLVDKTSLLNNSDIIKETYIILVLYYATNGPTPWEDTYGIATHNTSACDWITNGNPPTGIVCRRGRIKTIQMTDNRLEGTIPPELGYLNFMTTLELGTMESGGPLQNVLTGPIPSTLGLLSSLGKLSLRSNELTGVIPTELCLLSQLQNFNLQKNQIRGTVPDCLGLSSDKAMTKIMVHQNKLTGTVPQSIEYLTNLEILDLHGNQFTGSLPKLANHKSLVTLNLEDTAFTGTIPATWANLKSLTKFLISETTITGTIPPGLGSLEYLEKLSIKNNRFLRGTIPPFVATANNLKAAKLSNNSFEGTLDSFFSVPNSRLERLFGGYNHYTGTLPDLPESLQVVYLGHSNLTGPIPDSIGNLTNLFDFSIYHAQLTGSIPTTFGKLAGFKRLHLFRNALTGQIPSELGLCTLMEKIVIDQNRLTGTIPLEVSQLPNLWISNFSRNDIQDNLTNTFCQRDQLLEFLATDCLGNVVCPCCSDCCDEADICYPPNRTENIFDRRMKQRHIASIRDLHD